MKRLLFLSLCLPFTLTAQTPKRSGKVTTPPPTKPPLVAADIETFPTGTDHLDLILLIGQSNMKGRGFMPEDPKNDPRIVMMHMKTDGWFHARHPLHLTGDPMTFKGHDNAGVGSGLAFAEAIAAKNPSARIGLLPCAVGGSAISRWGKDGNLYVEALRRAKLALSQGPKGRTRLRAALWLQGEADSKPGRIEVYPAALNDLVDRLRSDLGVPDLPFIACTIGEMKPDTETSMRTKMNELLLDLPNHRDNTACVDARDLKGHIGDSVHFDTTSLEEIGRRYAAEYLELIGE
jgi:hypothetical protein